MSHASPLHLLTATTRTRLLTSAVRRPVAAIANGAVEWNAARFTRSLNAAHLSTAASTTPKASVASNSHGRKVAVLGAAGGIGQPLSLLLKQAPSLVSRLALYDVANVRGVAADLAHIATRVSVGAHQGPSELQAALESADVVVVPAGVPRKPGMTRDDLFNTNARIVHELATACAKYCPRALVLVISNPVNSTVPIFVEATRQPARILGVTTLDAQRASVFLADAAGTTAESNQCDPATTRVPVIGGHSGPTIVPLFSQTAQGAGLSRATLEALVKRVQYGGDEVVKAKGGAGSATLSMAVAGANFTFDVLRALAGNPVKAFAYVKSPVMKSEGIDYFASEIELCPNGVKSFGNLGSLSAYEKELMTKCIPELRANISKGLEFVASSAQKHKM